MIVHDIVHVVSPAAAQLTSWPAGRWWLKSFDDPELAEAHAKVCNGFRIVPGHEYVVEAKDESDPERAEPLTRAARDRYESRKRGDASYAP